MATKITQILHKRGAQENLPILDASELAYTVDTKEVYVGTGNENVKVLTSDASIGKLSNLKTSNKTNIVDAVNEIKTSLSSMISKNKTFTLEDLKPASGANLLFNSYSDLGVITSSISFVSSIYEDGYIYTGSVAAYSYLMKINTKDHSVVWQRSLGNKQVTVHAIYGDYIYASSQDGTYAKINKFTGVSEYAGVFSSYPRSVAIKNENEVYWSYNNSYSKTNLYGVAVSTVHYSETGQLFLSLYKDNLIGVIGTKVFLYDKYDVSTTITLSNNMSIVKSFGENYLVVSGSTLKSFSSDNLLINSFSLNNAITSLDFDEFGSIFVTDNSGVYKYSSSVQRIYVHSKSGQILSSLSYSKEDKIYCYLFGTSVYLGKDLFMFDKYNIK